MKLANILTGYKTYIVAVLGFLGTVGAYMDGTVTPGQLLIAGTTLLTLIMTRAGSKADAAAAATVVVSALPTPAQGLRTVDANLVDTVGTLLDRTRNASGTSPAA